MRIPIHTSVIALFPALTLLADDFRQLRLVAPGEGATVPLLSNGQKDFLDWEATGFWNRDLDFSHRQRFDKLYDGFDDFPGGTINERVEAYVLSLGFTP